MSPRFESHVAVRDEGAGHLLEIGAGGGAAGDPPQVELVGRAAVQPVDAVPAVDDARADEQDVFGGLRGQRPQCSAAQRSAARIIAVEWLRPG
ncbi:hypothetical protein DV36_20175 [Amycolatopsis mediterranei]|uniref:Uncharacterized protein n=1 Tax=Amycolatopsis mediterranei (strain S699) TaxID=713604 RepID=A0A9R0NZM3_AMYMS|nr:hypothetical protein RAM_25590 [Amycolatopsis mediterranei S699]KDU90367.1 hypothetical protein DV36_20175 [Amycolatopsis mediterranei]